MPQRKLTVLPHSVLAILACFTTTYGCRATEFCVVKTPHYWVIGADSMESVNGNPSATVDKIVQVGQFVVLRYGAGGVLGNGQDFNIDTAIAERLRDKTTQAEAFAAVKSLFDTVMSNMIAQHMRNKSRPNATLKSDASFRQQFNLGFVLLSVEKGNPLIDDYELEPDATVTGAIHRSSPDTEVARQLYKPAAFSVPFFGSYPVSIESDPDGAVRYLISNPLFLDGVGPPYVVKHFDGKTLVTIPENTPRPQAAATPPSP